MQIGTLVKLRNDEDRLGFIKVILSDGWTIVQLLSGSTVEADISQFIKAN